MSFAWQTVEQAAVTLGISTRTIARRIAKGELESRLNNGRREVYIQIPQAAKPQAAAHAPETIDADFTEVEAEPTPSYEETIRHTVSAAASNFGSADVETSTALILAEDRARRAEMAITVIQQSTALVREEVHRARFGARWAWGVVALMAVGVMVAVGWTTQNLTKSQAQTESLRDKVTVVNANSEQLERQAKADRERLEAELAAARQAAAKAEGQLEEVRSEAETAKAQLAAAKEKPATTRPSSVAAKIANAVFGGE
jgi:hypothetical protein